MFGLQMLNEMESLQREMDQIFRVFGTRPGYDIVRQNVGFKVSDNDDHYTVVAALPGLDTEKLGIDILGRQLTVSGVFATPDVPEDARWYREERRRGEFEQIIELPTNLDTEKIEAEYTNGILKIVLPKAASVLPKKIALKAD
ncbi:MAG: Hsp20/alpha crystallin family protein [Desulfuromusa sp.]|nr:Hsp20/alpha crystallin family protein [Desulfuromusa sp.]